MSLSCSHDLHFILDRGKKGLLMELDVFAGSKGLSGVIREILMLLIPVMRREHSWGVQRMSKYQAVCSDPDEIRDDLHVYMTEGLYRELKLLHQDLNFYSIAQLVRWLIDFFIGLWGRFGGDVVSVLKNIFARWRKESKETRQTTREIIRQLRRIIRHLPGENRLITIYNSHYSPFWSLRM